MGLVAFAIPPIICLSLGGQRAASGKILKHRKGVKVHHGVSAICNSGSVAVSSAGRLNRGASGSRSGAGLSRLALERASDTDRTAEIRRQASRIPQRWGNPPEMSAESAALTSPQRAGSLSFWAGAASSALGEPAMYSGLPTRNASGCRGMAPRMSSQNLSRRPSSFSELMSTRLYRSARHQERASPISAAQSTSIPSLLLTSARKARLHEGATRRTRFLLSGLGTG